MTKDGEITCFSPPNVQGRHKVKAWFTSGHVAELRGKKFLASDKLTPFVTSVDMGSPLLGNITWKGDLKKKLEGNQQDLFFENAEK
jgi:hypothetical protein